MKRHSNHFFRGMTRPLFFTSSYLLSTLVSSHPLTNPRLQLVKSCFEKKILTVFCMHIVQLSPSYCIYITFPLIVLICFVCFGDCVSIHKMHKSRFCFGNCCIAWGPWGNDLFMVEFFQILSNLTDQFQNNDSPVILFLSTILNDCTFQERVIFNELKGHIPMSACYNICLSNYLGSISHLLQYGLSNYWPTNFCLFIVIISKVQDYI